jgi:hypothetical protein
MAGELQGVSATPETRKLQHRSSPRENDAEGLGANGGDPNVRGFRGRRNAIRGITKAAHEMSFFDRG